jgi:AraC-like DNA-binding protein/mannose-6-phosphate isomerase-like protein (cupin superfamily)
LPSRREIENRLFINVQPPEEHRAVLSVVLEGRTCFAHVQHATYRERNQEESKTKRPIAHDVYHVVLVTSGRGSFLIDGRMYAARPGLLFLTSPGQPHSFSNTAGENAEFCEVTFQFFDEQKNALTRPLHEVVGTWVGRSCPAVTQIKASRALKRLILATIADIVVAGLAQEPDFNLQLNESLASVLLGLYRHVYRNVPEEPPDDPVRKVHDHILRHYADQLSLPDLASMAGLSVNYMAQRFKARNGTTPIFFQHRVRTALAGNLLETTHYPVKQIAGLVGFSDVYFFTRIFTKIQGVPPAKYRQLKWGTAAQSHRNTPLPQA